MDRRKLPPQLTRAGKCGVFATFVRQIAPDPSRHAQPPPISCVDGTGGNDPPTGRPRIERQVMTGTDSHEWREFQDSGRVMIIAFVGLAFAFGAAMLMASHGGELFADIGY